MEKVTALLLITTKYFNCTHTELVTDLDYKENCMDYVNLASESTIKNLCSDTVIQLFTGYNTGFQILTVAELIDHMNGDEAEIYRDYSYESTEVLKFALPSEGR